MHTPMLAEPLVATAEAAVEEATLDAAVLEEEPPQAVMAAAAPTTAEAFRKSRREIIFIIVFSFNSYTAFSTGVIVAHTCNSCVYYTVAQGKMTREQVHKIEGNIL